MENSRYKFPKRNGLKCAEVVGNFYQEVNDFLYYCEIFSLKLNLFLYFSHKFTYSRTVHWLFESFGLAH